MKQTIAKLAKAFVVVFVLVAAVLLSGCGDDRERIDSDTLRSTRIDGEILATVEYDGHLWVMCSRGLGGGIVHHPDCPACQDENQ